MIAAEVAAPIVRVQEGPAPVAAGVGVDAAARYALTRVRLQRVDTDFWKPKLKLNYLIGVPSQRVVFFFDGRYVGSDVDFGRIGQIGQVGERTSRSVSFALTLYRANDSRCCPRGRAIDVRFHWNGRRLVLTRPLLRPGAEPAEGLQLPSRNIGCIFNQSPASIRCDVRSGLRPAPPRPKSCDLDWAYGLTMTPRSRPHTFCAGDTALATGPILAYGATVKLLGFTCTSARTGLRCTNNPRHGFFLSRQRWRVF